MRTINLDAAFKCHTENDGTFTAVETDFFDGKCDAYIEGYRFIPEGASRTGSSGITFTGEMTAPWKDYSILGAYQESYEEAKADLTGPYAEAAV